jgi:hypothetical protein
MGWLIEITSGGEEKGVTFEFGVTEERGLGLDDKSEGSLDIERCVIDAEDEEGDKEVYEERGCVKDVVVVVVEFIDLVKVV